MTVVAVSNRNARRRQHELPYERRFARSRNPLTLELRVPRLTKERSAPSGNKDIVPSWIATVIGRLKRVAALSPGWSHGGGQAVDRSTLPIAFKIIMEVVPPSETFVPQIVPVADGGLQLEWHRDGFDLEIEITPIGEAFVDYATVDGAHSWEGDYSDLNQRIAKVLHDAAAKY